MEKLPDFPGWGQKRPSRHWSRHDLFQGGACAQFAKTYNECKHERPEERETDLKAAGTPDLPSG
jgi:hypothetical protein